MNEVWMQRALALAELGCYSALPNPMVGCVIVKNGVAVGEGFHAKTGSAHAETQALAQAGRDAADAIVYLTLEPCCHYGRTPPCVNSLIEAKVKTVYVACLDPNPLVAGKGIQALRAAGIEVKMGLMEPAARELNRAFFQYITTKTPYVIGKWAMSLDGKMSVNCNDDPALSSKESFQDLHDLRRRLPAILIGAETARRDNPALTARTHNADANLNADSAFRQPQRIILNSKADLAPTLKLFDGSLPGQTWLICAPENSTKATQRFPAASTLILPCVTQHGVIDLHALMRLLGEREIAALLVEGGPRILNAFFGQGLIHEVITYLTPWIIADLPHKLRTQITTKQVFADDYKITAKLLP